MKQHIKTALCLALVFAAVILSVSCGKKNGGAESDAVFSGEPISKEGIVGVWSLPESEWLVSGKAEVWEFTEDGKYYHRQLDSAGNYTDSVDGTYAIDADKLTLTVSGYLQPPLTVAFPDADTMVYKNHEEKTITLKRQ